ncbi:MAG: V-type ATPase 116kDa subunit family protein [Anaerococcus hydrogenalis]|uniref:V-type ATP synthase subunit I n=1 Tax=Anaerococcus hydrogenalis TaxID=33029 RepID=UPI002905577C|nr:V-type ATPase 116kDa subunit family protein [Anaerococcus hydrogenalis]MDU2582301.1 V-type ATPase 116kDa subunit family protein [Anaerococcus hydrogenalis]
MNLLEKFGFKDRSRNNRDQSIKSGNEDYLLVYPKSVEDEVNRTISSLGFIDKDIPDGKSIDEIRKEYEDNKAKLKEIDNKLKKIKDDNIDDLKYLPKTIDFYKKSSKLKDKMLKGRKYFYLSGWVPESKIQLVKDTVDKYEDSLVDQKKNSQTIANPPTKLKNNKITRPFEFLVNMYGAPNYNEIDPTGFFAITYMLLYGMMFGDLGQGLVFVLASFLIEKKSKIFGQLIRRIGFSASFFGLMYGSVFGIEDLIPTILIKPFDNIIKVLIASVAFGVILMVIAYILGIYNKLHKQKDFEEGVFGKEGFAGLLMMISFILIILNIVKVNPMPMTVSIILLILSIVMMVFKQPISRKLLDIYPIYDQSSSDYYIESSFSIIEALLSVFSNLVSFTRVGAFAINHVGLYMAFEVMSKLVGGGFIGIIILILGNILIIGLEGMIVFIQGLRLEFYEMFSKYYKGDGQKFSPISKL